MILARTITAIEINVAPPSNASAGSRSSAMPSRFTRSTPLPHKEHNPLKIRMLRRCFHGRWTIQQLRQIGIDLEVNCFVESKRTSFNQTHNDILRSIAGLPPSAAQTSATAKPALNGDAGAWSGKGGRVIHSGMCASVPSGWRIIRIAVSR
jgi:hypothetical protein